MIMKYHVIFVTYLVGYVTAKYCYWNTGCLYKYFSAKTPYDSVRGDIRDSVLKLKGCEPVSIWSLFRHGQRTPSSGFEQQMRNVLILKENIILAHKNKKSALCAQDIENIKKWTWKESNSKVVHELKPEGYDETLRTAKRLTEAFPELLSSLEDGSYTFRGTQGEWIDKSMEALVQGLTEGSGNITIDESISDKYDNIASFWSCNYYLKEVRFNPNAYSEMVKYQNTDEFRAVKENLLNRIGIEYPLTADNVTALYDLCRYFWSGVDNRPSPWCAIFTTEDLRVLEYVADLRIYYRNAYGNWMNQKLGSTSLGDLYNNFERVKDGKGKKLVSYMTQGTTISMVASALGIYRDEMPLSGERIAGNRKWRSSVISPFGANLIAVMYRCNGEDKQDYKIAFHLNEDRLQLCPNGWCSWEEFETKFKPYVDTNLDFCNSTSSTV